VVKISTRINLEINREIRDKKLEKKLSSLEPITRIKTRIQFKTKSGYSNKWSAIIDTGAHTSILPFHVWKDIEIEVLCEHKIYGLIPKKECGIPVLIANIKGFLLDEFGNKTKELKFLSCLAYNDDIDILLGFRDLLNNLKLFIDVQNDKAYLETL